MVCAAAVCYFIGVGLLIPEVPRFLAGPLHQGDSVVGASVAAFSVAAVLGRLPLARVGDRLSRRSMLASGAVTVAVGDLLVAAAPSLASVFMMRVLGGLGDALFYTAAMSAVIDAVPPELMTRVVSALTTCMFAGMLAGPVAGEAIRSAAGYQPVWWAAVLSSAVAAVGAAAPVARSAHRTAAPVGWAALLRRIALPLGVYVLASVGLAGYTSYLPLYAGQLGQRNVAPEFVVLVGGTAVARPAAGRLVDRVGQRAAVVGLLAAEGGGLAAAAAWPAPAGLLLSAALLAAAQALGLPVFLLIGAGRLPAGRRTAAVAAVTAGYDIGYGAAAAGLGPVAARAGFPAMFLAAACVTVAGIPLALRIGDSSQRKERL
jgi:predicted MFS family arabinose efflux permease